MAVEPGRRPRLAGLIDFGDMIETQTVAEVAVAAAYATFGADDPLGPILPLVAAYHRLLPLTGDELALVDILIRTRLAVSVVNSACRAAAEPDDPYLTVSEGPAWAALEALERIPPRLAHYSMRDACGLPPAPHGPAVVRWLKASSASFVQVLEHDLRAGPVAVLDLSVGSRMLGADPSNLETPRLSETISKAMKDAGAAVGIGRYDEARAIYTTGAFAAGDAPGAERRTVHLGIDLSVPPGSAVRAPLDGEVHIVARNEEPKDYGPLVVLRHEIPSGEEFFTLYGHLDPDSVARLSPGKALRGGRGLRRRRRAAGERRLVAARPRPDHPGPPRPRPGLPGRGPARPARRSGPASRRTPTWSWASPQAASPAGAGQGRRPWTRAAGSSAITSASLIAIP